MSQESGDGISEQKGCKSKEGKTMLVSVLTIISVVTGAAAQILSMAGEKKQK